nr:MAG TPA: hypothetical protein [Caudoviricetes sp.]
MQPVLCFQREVLSLVSTGREGTSIGLLFYRLT